MTNLQVPAGRNIRTSAYNLITCASLATPYRPALFKELGQVALAGIIPGEEKMRKRFLFPLLLIIPLALTACAAAGSGETNTELGVVYRSPT
jgi:hypothetical protein